MRCSEPDQTAPTGPRLPARDAVRLLGSVELVGPDGPVPLTEDVARLLGLLALRVGEVVPAVALRDAETLDDAASDCAAPDRAASENAASDRAASDRGDPDRGDPENAASDCADPDDPCRLAGLAAALTAAGLPDALRTDPAGPRLAIPAERVDAHAFTALAAGGRSRMAAGELASAADLFAAALRRWRAPVGRPPLTGCAMRPAGWAARDVARLTELRVATIEARWTCALRIAAAAHVASGGPAADRSAIAAGERASRSAAQAVAELEAVLAAEPGRPGAWELLLVAAFLSAGRTAAERVAARAAQIRPEEPGPPAGAARSGGVTRADPAHGRGGRLTELVPALRRGDLVEVWLASPVVPDEQPAPATSDGAGPVPPPVPLTRLVGRDRLLAAVDGQLATARLVTLTGPGGAGKTRLAVAVARRWRTGPVWFVDLVAVTSPVRVPEAVAGALGVRDEAGRDAVDALADALGPGPGLLVLDNCEHLVAGCAELVGRLSARRPRLRVLATSRSALRVPGEVVWGVPPLAVPPPDAGRTLAGLAAHPASQLFLERARARAGRPVPAASAGAVAELCAELDGLPLAIELAAARTSTLDVGEIVARIRSDLRLLRNSDPTAPARHRTLAATIESSVDQLDPRTAALFDRLAVVPGGVDDALARALAGPDASTGLAALLDASLLAVAPAEPPSVAARSRMLVPIRRHALGRLVASGGEAAARRDFAGYCLDLAERAERELTGAGQEAWLRRLRAEAPNLRAAMSWLAEAGAAGPPHGDLRMAVALAPYHRLVGSYREARSWLAAALTRHPGAPAALRARAGTAAAMFALLLCEYPAAAEHAAAARLACRAIGDRPGEARVEMILGAIARERARYAESAAHLATASVIFAERGDEAGEAQSAQLRGFTAWLAGDLDRADSRLRASLRWCGRLGDPRAGASALTILGAVALYRGHLARAEALLATALRRCSALGYPEGLGWAHNLCGLAELRRGRTDRAAHHLGRSLALHRQVGDRWRTASVLEALAEVARRRGAPWRAAGLLGAADRIRAEIGAPVPGCERPDADATAAALRGELGGGGFAEAHRRGGQAPLDALLERAEPDRTPTPAEDPVHPRGQRAAGQRHGDGRRVTPAAGRR